MENIEMIIKKITNCSMKTAKQVYNGMFETKVKRSHSVKESQIAYLRERQLISLGLTPNQATRLHSALKLSRFVNFNKISDNNILTPDKVFRRYAVEVASFTVEVFVVIGISSAGQVIGDKIMFTGGKTSSIVDIGEVMRYLIELGATSFIVCHNHPSGNDHPSPEDINITQQLKAAGEMLSISLMDHVIFISNSYISLNEIGYI